MANTNVAKTRQTKIIKKTKQKKPCTNEVCNNNIIITIKIRIRTKYYITKNWGM